MRPLDHIRQILRTPVIGKPIKIFKKRNDAEPCTEVTDSDTVKEAQWSKEGGPNNNETGLDLVIEFGEGNEDTTDDED